jgi:enoyl-CoA hydratase/carnithine racemase
VTNTKRGFYTALEAGSDAAMQAEEARELECFRSDDTRKAFAAFVARKRQK